MHTRRFVMPYVILSSMSVEERQSWETRLSQFSRVYIPGRDSRQAEKTGSTGTSTQPKAAELDVNVGAEI